MLMRLLPWFWFCCWSSIGISIIGVPDDFSGPRSVADFSFPSSKSMFKQSLPKLFIWKSPSSWSSSLKSNCFGFRVWGPVLRSKCTSLLKLCSLLNCPLLLNLCDSESDFYLTGLKASNLPGSPFEILYTLLKVLVRSRALDFFLSPILPAGWATGSSTLALDFLLGWFSLSITSSDLFLVNAVVGAGSSFITSTFFLIWWSRSNT